MAAADTSDVTRRDFLYIATGSMAVIGTAFALWPFLDQMNPDASVKALASVELDLAPVAEGQSITIKWRGNPVFIRHRTQKEIEAARAVKLDELPDPYARNDTLPESAPATDQNRATKNEKYIVMLGVCTHLGCVPLGEQGDYGGWFCPCHGSHYDTAGRVRKGPAPQNLEVPPHEFLSDTMIRIG